MRTTSRTATPASTAAAFGAVRLSEEGSADAGCAATWATRQWTEEEEEAFEVEAVVRKVLADGQPAYANQGRVAAGVVLYRIL
eukprot:4383885-Pleurochrysis_carterae.AAC.1